MVVSSPWAPTLLSLLMMTVQPSRSNGDFDRGRIVVRKMPVRPGAWHSDDFFVLHLLKASFDGGAFGLCRGIIGNLLQLQGVVSGCSYSNRLLLCPSDDFPVCTYSRHHMPIRQEYGRLLPVRLPIPQPGRQTPVWAKHRQARMPSLWSIPETNSFSSLLCGQGFSEPCINGSPGCQQERIIILSLGTFPNLRGST